MTLSAAQVTARDLYVRQLEAIAREDSQAARTAGERLAQLIEALIAVKIADGRRQVVRDLALVPIARRWALRPKEMERDSTITVGPEPRTREGKGKEHAPAKRKGQKKDSPAYVYPPGFEPILAPEQRTLAVWEADAFEAVGYFDRETRHSLEHLKREFEFGIAEKIVPKTKSDLDAYVEIARVRQNGRMSVAQIRAELDPDQVHDRTATVAWGIGHVLSEKRDEPHDAIRTVDQWWDLAILLLFAFSPEFDGTAVGFIQPVRWRDSGDEEMNIFAHRAEIFWLCTLGGASVTHDRTGEILNLLQRTTDRLLAAQRNMVTPKAAVRVPTTAVEPEPQASGPKAGSKRGRHRSPAPAGWSYLVDIRGRHGIGTSLADFYKNKLGHGQSRKDPGSGQVLVETSAFEALLKQHGRLNDG